MHRKQHLEFSLSIILLLILVTTSPSVYGQGKTKMYLEMSESEQQAFIAKTADSVSFQFGNRNGLSDGE